MKLHLGCGKRYLEGYIHVDIAEFEHIDYQLPIDDLSTFKDNTAEEIYASHVLEYFDRNDVINVLTEWKRVQDVIKSFKNSTFNKEIVPLIGA